MGMTLALTPSPVLLVLADAAAKATAFLLLAALMAWRLRVASAALRHRLWTLTLGLLAVLPAMSWSLPGWGWAISTSTAPVVLDRSPPTINVSNSSTIESKLMRFDAVPPLRAAARIDPIQSFDPGRVLVTVWSLGLCIAVWPLVVGLIANERRRQRSRPSSDDDLNRLFRSCALRLGIGRPVELRMGPGPLVPMTWGLARPIVLLPDGSTHWSETTRELVLLHELTHVQRRDVAALMIGRVVASLYWFHPLAWHALRRLRIECEHACDDHVVRIGARRAEYAAQLVALARSSRCAPGLSSSVVSAPMTRASTLERRIMALLDDSRGHGPLKTRPAAALLASAVLVAVAIGTLYPWRVGAAPPPQGPAPTPPASNTQERPATTESKAQPGGEAMETSPITVTGRAIGPDGQPLPGARVYLASTKALHRRIAETTADDQGRFAMRDVPLPIEKNETTRGLDLGLFQVFGEADGLGFAWRPQKVYFPHPIPTHITIEPARRDPPETFRPGDPIVLDLRFPPSREVTGTIVDENGKPLQAARVELRGCTSLLDVDRLIPGWDFNALNGPDSVPASMKVRVTDERGRFAFSNMPPDCQLRFDVRAEGHPSHWVHVLTSPGPKVSRDGFPLLAGKDMTLTFVTPHDVTVRLIQADTAQPAPNARVGAFGNGIRTGQTTNDQGLATLRLPPGAYDMEALPATGTPYLVTSEKLVVGDQPPDQPIEMKLRAAGTLDIQVIRDDTGEGISNVGIFQRNRPDGPLELLGVRSFQAPRTSRYDRPQTGDDGKVRAFVEPGKRTLWLFPKDDPLIDARHAISELLLDLRPGETTRIKVVISPQPSARARNAPAPPSPEPTPTAAERQP
jgi:beta-lactamase regulating signal transducer with metallopeptidase domain